MATGKQWLSKMKRNELAELAEHLNLKDYKSAKKSELELMCEEHLNKNQSILSSDAKVTPFYTVAETKSPEKEKKPRQRRQTLKSQEAEAISTVGVATSSALQTPSRAAALARKIPLPPSPAVIADRIDAQTTTLRASASKYLPKITFPPALQPQNVRATLSSPTAIQLAVLLLEAWGLRSQLLPLRYLTTIPAIPAIGISWETPVKIPDLFALLTAAFWGPFSLWVVTSIGLPLLGAWFVNLRGGETGYDPVSFNVVKALVAWIVYNKAGVSGDATKVVAKGVYGGATGMLIGAGIGALAGLYEGVLMRK